MTRPDSRQKVTVLRVNLRMRLEPALSSVVKMEEADAESVNYASGTWELHFKYVGEDSCGAQTRFGLAV